MVGIFSNGFLISLTSLIFYLLISPSLGFSGWFLKLWS